MSILRGDIKRGWSEWVVRLLVIAFAFRALVPLGYMPDFSALSKGVLKVVICTGSGSKVVNLDADGKPHPQPQKAPHGDQPCSFGGLVALDLPAFDFVPVSAFSQHETVLPRLAVTIPPARAGPALGSRGPPVIS